MKVGSFAVQSAPWGLPFQTSSPLHLTKLLLQGSMCCAIRALQVHVLIGVQHAREPGSGLLLVTAESSQGASEQWPAGCLGYAVNLVKPCFPTHRSKVLSHLLGSLMVFETKDQACAYRHRVIQVNIKEFDIVYISGFQGMICTLQQHLQHPPVVNQQGSSSDQMLHCQLLLNSPTHGQSCMFAFHRQLLPAIACKAMLGCLTKVDCILLQDQNHHVSIMGTYSCTWHNLPISGLH